MNTLYRNTTVFIAGDNSILYKEILAILLRQGMTVIVAVPPREAVASRSISRDNALAMYSNSTVSGAAPSTPMNSAASAAVVTTIDVMQPSIEEDDYLDFILKQQLVILETDTSDEVQIERLVNTITKEHGPIDLALYLSDQTRVSPSLMEITAAEWGQMLTEDLSAYLYTAKAVLKQMTQAKGGLYLHLVNQENFMNEGGNALANIAAVAQMETAGILAQEVAASRVNYHHIGLQNLLLGNTGSSNNSGDTVIPVDVAQYILDLYTDYHANKADTFKVFGKISSSAPQNLPF